MRPPVRPVWGSSFPTYADYEEALDNYYEELQKYEDNLIEKAEQEREEEMLEDEMIVDEELTKEDIYEGRMLDHYERIYENRL